MDKEGRIKQEKIQIVNNHFQIKTDNALLIRNICLFFEGIGSKRCAFKNPFAKVGPFQQTH